MQNGHPLLTVKNLNISFRSDREWRQVVHGLDFELSHGHCLGVVGESGSGKSVTALSIMRLLPGTARTEQSSIIFQSTSLGAVDLLSLPGKRMRKLRGNEISMIFQEPMSALNPVMKCGKQVLEVLRLHQDISRESAIRSVRDWFDRVELPAKTYDAYPHEISGGQKQRVMIAMAMCCEPSLLIADEPTTALDVTIQARILQLLRDLQQEHNMGVMFITHDLGVVAEIADEVMVMRQGQKVEHQPVLSLFEHPQEPYTKGLLACRPSLEVRVNKLPTVDDFMNPVDTEKEEATMRESILKESTEPLLEVQGLRTWFPIRKGGGLGEKDWIKAVDNISFELYPGETLGLVGESGCGKTTLGRSILRLVDPVGGEVVYRGNALLVLSKKDMRVYRKDLQIIFQDPYSSLNPRMRIGDALLECMYVHGIGRGKNDRIDRAREILARVGLEPAHYSRYPHEFSGGQRQRICIARALILEPEMVICDESVSALDVSVQAQILNLLKDLQQKQGLAYLFISHDLSVVKHMSHRIMVMQSGKIIEVNQADKLYEQPQREYTQTLIQAIPKGSLERIREIRSPKE